MPYFTLWGRTLKVDASEFFTTSTFICRPRGKEVSLFEKVLVSAGCIRSGKKTEGKEVCDRNEIGSSVTKVRDILEFVLATIRT